MDMKQAQFHCHTVYSNNKKRILGTESLVTPERMLSVAKEKNLSAVAITDHNTMDGYHAALPYAEKYGITLIPAMEIDTNESGQILAYGISAPVTKGLSPKEAIERVHDQNGIAIIAHPFDILRKIHALRQVYLLADGMETMNYGATDNLRTQAFAEENKVAIRTAGADAHTARLLDAITMDFKDECSTVADYLNALRRNDFVVTKHMHIYKALLIGLANVINTSIFHSQYFRRKVNKISS